ncbi:MAG: hypothetical protein EWV82_12505 [Microcystis aeruginosa Ma_AC_P_19900807_S299]|nr:MAG: hypothetical protein EWV82_12505 [Microcystis aeruginosa Ma_AC_P_19900807_S299]
MSSQTSPLKIRCYSGKRLSEIQTKLCLAWFIARDTVPHTTAHRYIAVPDWMKYSRCLTG